MKLQQNRIKCTLLCLGLYQQVWTSSFVFLEVTYLEKALSTTLREEKTKRGIFSGQFIPQAWDILSHDELPPGGGFF